MKYGKILDENIISEYKKFYIDYKYLKKNILQERKEFIYLLTKEINKVENFFLENKEKMLNINNFCLFNLFSILKIVKKYQKKSCYDISDDIYNVYFKKSFYLYLMTNVSNDDSILLNDYNKCSVCYDNNIYILKNKRVVYLEKSYCHSHNATEEELSVRQYTLLFLRLPYLFTRVFSYYFETKFPKITNILSNIF